MSQIEHLTTVEETTMDIVPEETSGDARPLDEPVPMSFPAVLRDMGMPRFEVATDSAVLKPDIENGRRAAVGDGGTDEVEDAGSAPSDHRARVGDGGGTDGGGTGGTGSGNSGTKACAGELIADGIAEGGVELELDKRKCVWVWS